MIAADQALDESLDVLQRGSQTAAGQALNDLAVRFSAGNSRLAQLIRQDQDLAAQARSLDEAIIGAVGKDPSRAAAATQAVRDQISAVAKAREDLDRCLPRLSGLRRTNESAAADSQGHPGITRRRRSACRRSPRDDR